MARFRLFRRKGGRHAAPRATAVPPARQQPAFLPLYAAVQPPTGSSPPQPLAAPPPVRTPKVGLVLSDGAHLVLADGDEAAEAFRALAHELSQGLE